ncbi:STAS domain-containing protein [Kineococcus rhizosphaerae]|uniref:Anti-anti-sigma factor n=1 Tax=Kineococcus rhizosphaerae TaxID=559628 RepID=A0A2T0R3E3_9ACTN|nr:STAS domain-containing protein [Kineococcus rhizosphaerae]PRY14555.1 anti-anti-sigma factor [Kineococcus rhizosphaerae]
MSTPSPEPSSPRSPDLREDRPDGLVTVERDGDRVLVHLSGEIDDELRLDLDEAAARVGTLLRSRPRAGGDAVHVEATGVSFMDSAGAAFLARLAVLARPARVSVAPSRTVAFLLDVTALADVLDVTGDVIEDVTGDVTDPDGRAGF